MVRPNDSQYSGQIEMGLLAGLRVRPPNQVAVPGQESRYQANVLMLALPETAFRARMASRRATVAHVQGFMAERRLAVQTRMEYNMITCPWCGTSYERFQSFCSQCGGSLPAPAEETTPQQTGAELAAPPLPPRKVPRRTALRMLFTDGFAIASLIFLLMGAIFGLLGVALTISGVAAFVGVPFAALGVLFLAAGIPILVWRLRKAQATVSVLEQGQAVVGEIVNVRQEYRVRVNGRHPWVVDYAYEVAGSSYQGQVTTLSMPDLSQQPGKAVYVLYLGHDPEQSTLYPSPYGYYA